MISIIENTRWVSVTRVFSIGYNKTKSLTKAVVVVSYRCWFGTGSFLNIVLLPKNINGNYAVYNERVYMETIKAVGEYKRKARYGTITNAPKGIAACRPTFTICETCSPSMGIHANEVDNADGRPPYGTGVARREFYCCGA